MGEMMTADAILRLAKGAGLHREIAYDSPLTLSADDVWRGDLGAFAAAVVRAAEAAMRERCAQIAEERSERVPDQYCPTDQRCVIAAAIRALK